MGHQITKNFHQFSPKIDLTILNSFQKLIQDPYAAQSVGSYSKPN